MILFSHPTPTRSVRHTAWALHRAGLLGEFWTYSGKRAHLVTRNIAGVAAKPPTSPTPDFSELFGVCPWDQTSADLVFPGGEAITASPPELHALDREMCARLSRAEFDGVYAYEQGAKASFRAAGRSEILRVYHVPLGNWRGSHPILIEEAMRAPEWAVTLGGCDDAPAGFARTQAELADANLVFVDSTFAAETLEQTSEFPGIVAIASPGAPLPPFEADGYHPQDGHADTLRVLLAGPLSQRAGLSYAFGACRQLGSSVTLTVVAPPPDVSCAPLRRELDHVRWLATASMDVMRREMIAADVLLAPAIYDTTSEVLLQALAAGLPVIATSHSAAPDLIRDGVEGWIVPIRSPEPIVAKLELLRTEPDRRAEMSRMAQRRARKCTWRRYEDIVAAGVGTALARRSAPLTA